MEIQVMSHPKRLSIDSVVQRSADVIAAEAGQDLVMVSIENGFYYGVSDVARDIWETLERPMRVSDLLDNLAASYDVDRSSCEEQTFCFLEELLAEKLLQVRNETP
jgi:hypothetical protein